MNLLYDDLAPFWPLLSPPRDYRDEAQRIRQLLLAYGVDHPPADGAGGDAGRPRPALLELGAGGGHTLCHLTDTFDAVAVDLSAPMLENCRNLNPDVECIVGDMRSIRLGRQFDAVLCHDAIDYITGIEDLAQVFETARVHLRPGGIFIAAPTYTREEWVENQIETDQHGDGRFIVSYMSYVYDPDPADTRFEMVMVILIRDGAELRVFEDRHTCGLFDSDTWLRTLEDRGFDAAIEPDEAMPYRLFIGRRPDPAPQADG